MMIVRNLEEKITKGREKRGRIKIMMNRKIEGLIFVRNFIEIEVHRVYVDVNTIIMAGSLLTAVVVIFSAIFAVYKWYLKQNQQDVEIERVKSEQCLLTYGILACLKGLKEQGCNGPVTEAIDKIEKHINKQAHDQED